ncbi:DUF3305 domain-containing protein [Roseomonas sp. HJA6]|uniref:DUF3305 domain-containing protein n=1 Tax=Roseomonas alba TaxID=2846776 RepID=A0ABS7AI64_9PROT|nr:DUF3305 domain-containing protein [Neoroseomonas alba]MBW6400834.1 DUF3305 domain-containing protein [Neoroseomonas alba]
MTLDVPGSIRIPVAVLAERRPGVTPWAEHAWAAVDVLEDIPPVAPWSVLREDAGRTLFFAGVAEIALYPSDTDNYIHNLQQAAPNIWVVLRPVEEAPGYRLQAATLDAGEAQIFTEAGDDLVEALPLPRGLRLILERFIAEHHRERTFHKRRRDRADTEALGRRAPVEEP